MEKWETTAPVVVASIAGLLVLAWIVLWTIDYAAVQRAFGEMPREYWRVRYDFLQTVRGLIDVSGIYALIGIAFIGLSMWAHRHPHNYESRNWPPAGWNRFVDMGEREPVNDFDAPASWEASAARGDGRELKFNRYIKIEENGYSYWSESVSITVRPYWAWHIWPRTFYRLSVEFVGTEEFHNPASDTNDNVSIYHPDARIHVTFKSGDHTFGPINMEKAVTNNEGVSYDYGNIRKLMEFLEKNPGAVKVRVDLTLKGKSVGVREFDSPDNLTAGKVSGVHNVWEARR